MANESSDAKYQIVSELENNNMFNVNGDRICDVDDFPLASICDCGTRVKISYREALDDVALQNMVNLRKYVQKNFPQIALNEFYISEKRLELEERGDESALGLLKIL